VTGFDDVPIATQTVPQLTTVRQDIAGGARAMVDLLTQRIAGVETPSTIMAPELVVRESACQHGGAKPPGSGRDGDAIPSNASWNTGAGVPPNCARNGSG
jgi:hypothetical protein